MNKCVECGISISSYNTYTYHGEDFCEKCYKKYIYTCPCCGGKFDGRKIPKSNKKVNGKALCPQCAKSMVTKCENCGKTHFLFRKDKEDNINYCENCLTSAINSYHHSQSAFPFFAYGKKGIYKSRRGANENKYFGIELEMDQDSNKCDKGVDYKFTLLKILKVLNKQAYFETDCSLGTNGAELITYPHTIDAFYHLDWQKVFKLAISHKYRSHNSGRCGLHYHFNKAFFGKNDAQRTENIAKVLVFYNLFWNDLVKFSRRNGAEIDRWAGKPQINGSDSDLKIKANQKRVENNAKEAASNRYAGRYQAVNLRPSGETIEFRLMRGTLNYETFMATTDFNINIVKKSKELKWEEVWDYKNWLKDVNEGTIAYMKKRKCFAEMYNEQDGQIIEINNEGGEQ